MDYPITLFFELGRMSDLGPFEPSIAKDDGLQSRTLNKFMTKHGLQVLIGVTSHVLKQVRVMLHDKSVKRHDVLAGASIGRSLPPEAD